MKQKKSEDVEQDAQTEEEEYEVEDILDIRIFKNKPKYLVKWKGFPDSENTWEPESNLNNLEAFAEKMKMLKAARMEARSENKTPRSTSGGSTSRSEAVAKHAASVSSSDGSPVQNKKQKKMEAPAVEIQVTSLPSTPSQLTTTSPTPKNQVSSSTTPGSQPEVNNMPSQASVERVKPTVASSPRSKIITPGRSHGHRSVSRDGIQTAAENEEAVEVEDLLDYKPRFKKDYFLVRWKGDWEDSWEPRHNLLIVGDLMNKMVDLKMSYLHIYGPSEMEQETFVTVQSIRISGAATLSAVIVEMTRDAEARTLLPLQEVRRRWPQQLLDFLLSRLRLRASGESAGDRSPRGPRAHMFPLK